MWDKVLRFGQPGLVLLLGVMLFFWQRLSPLLPWGIEKLVGITIALVAGIVFYFDRRLDSLSQKQVLDHISISDGISIALRHANRPQIIRIFALSTYLIQPIMKDVRAQTKQCVLLLYDPSYGHGQNESRPQESKTALTDAMIREWWDMKSDGFISELEIKMHSLYPLGYFILFDDRALLLGRYLIQDQRFPRCETQEPCLILDKTSEGKIMIRKHLEAFENLRTSEKSHPLPNPMS